MSCPTHELDEACITCKLAGLATCPFQGGPLPLAKAPTVKRRKLALSVLQQKREELMKRLDDHQGEKKT